MKCPECEAWTSVVETRQRQDLTTYRRYQCANSHRFTTTEQVVMTGKKTWDSKTATQLPSALPA